MDSTAQTSSPDPEWKKGSAELLVLSLLEGQPRHGYDTSKLIQARSGGTLRYHVMSLYLAGLHHSDGCGGGMDQADEAPE